MKVIHPSIYESRRRAEKRELRKKQRPFIVMAVLMIAYVAYASLRPIPLISAEVRPISFTYRNDDKPMNYPFSVSLYADGYGTVSELDPLTPRPTASTIKVLVATLVLIKKPLKLGEQGEQITFTEADAARYREMLANNESVVPVNPGASISQYEALQMLLISSANNIAEKLVTWAYGSVEEYQRAAKSYGDNKGLARTTLADVSGFSSSTKSTAADMQIVVQEALKNPVIAQIVATKEATVGSTVLTNTNKLLGADDIDGLKTGYTDEAGGCLLLTQTKNIDGERIRLSAVILGAPDKAATFTTGQTVLGNAKNFVALTNIASKGTNVGFYSVPWGQKVEVITADHLDAIAIKGQEVFANTNAKPTGPAAEGTVVGQLTKGKKSVDVVLKSDIPPPTLLWRITHPR